MSEPRLARWQERASTFLEPDEQVTAAAPGQKGEGFWLISFLVDAIAMPFLKRARLYLVTDRNVYVCRLSSWRGYDIEEVLVKRPLADAHVSYRRGRLSLQGADSVNVGLLPVGRKWARQVAAAAASPGPVPGRV